MPLQPTGLLPPVPLPTAGLPPLMPLPTATSAGVAARGASGGQLPADLGTTGSAETGCTGLLEVPRMRVNDLREVIRLVRDLDLHLNTMGGLFQLSEVRMKRKLATQMVMYLLLSAIQTVDGRHKGTR